MNKDNVDIVKTLAADFRQLTRKVKKDNENKTKTINDTLQILTTCKREYQNIYLKPEKFKKKLKEKNEEILKYETYYRNNLNDKTRKTEKKKISLADIEFN